MVRSARASSRQCSARSGGSDGVDDEYAHRSMDGFGAFILGRNMFGPIRGPWPDESWKGWWGDNPPYHAPTFVLTHYPRDPIEMEGGTTFFFVTDGIEAALEQAKRRRQWSRRQDRRWRRDGAPISSRRTDRRTAFRVLAGRARARRSDVRRDRPAGAWLPRHRTSGDRARHPHRSQPIGAVQGLLEAAGIGPRVDAAADPKTIPKRAAP